MTVFGICPDHSRWRLEDEFEFVRQLDSKTPIVITRSNNNYGWAVQGPVPDAYGVAVYKRVFDATVTKRYFEYPYPAWMYAFFGGINELTQGKPMILHELQVESWLAPGFSMPDAPIDELYKTMNPERLEDRFSYAVATGIRTIDLWGVEWWYQMKVKRGTPELWDTAKVELAKYR